MLRATTAQGDTRARRVAAGGLATYHVAIVLAFLLAYFNPDTQMVLPTTSPAWRYPQVIAVAVVHLTLALLLNSYSRHGHSAKKSA